MAVENDYAQLQGPFRIRKSLRELVHKPNITKNHRHSLHLLPLPPHDRNTDEYAYDVLYECQRGSLAIGYSSKTLLQFDPNPWCDADMKFTPMNVENYQLPDPTWEWISKDWMIDMTEDVDEAGWQYALKFHGAVWHGNYKHFRSFVRRRRWIRLRHRSLKNLASNSGIFKNEKSTKSKESDDSSKSLLAKTGKLIDVEEPDNQSEPSNSNVIHNGEEIMNKLAKCRLDRERLAVLEIAINSTQPRLENYILEKAVEYMEVFDYDDSKFKFLAHLLQKKYSSVTGDVTLTVQEKTALQSLRFYYDIQSIIDSVDSFIN